MTRREALALLAVPAVCPAAEDLTAQWRRIAAQVDGTVGATAVHRGTGQRASFNGGDKFPLASVCKLPLAAHMLALVEEGKFSLSEEIEVPRHELYPPVSVIAERWEQQHRFTLDQMLEWMVAKSDNTAVLTLFRIGGGAPAMAARFRQWQVEGIRLDRNEREANSDAEKVGMQVFLNDPRDTATPDGVVDLLQKLYTGNLLSAVHTSRLIQIMEKTTTGPARLKGLLPAGLTVAHKTGTTGDVGKLNGSTNDVGVLGGLIAIAVFVKGSTASLSAREHVIAEIAKTAWDSWVKV